MRDTAGRLTVLTTLGIGATKTFTRREGDGRIHIEGYGRARRFRCREIETDDEGRWLRRLFGRRDSFVVLGEPVGWPEGELRRRLSEDDGEDRATLRDVPRLWMPVDLDHLNFEPWAGHEDGETLALEALQMLGLRGRACVWHLTGSHAIEGRYRIRLWLPLRDPVTCRAMKLYARRWKDLTVDEGGKRRACVDTSILRPAQPIYTGTPAFVGMDDPVGRRSGTIAGERLRIRDVEVEEKRKRETTDENVERLRDSGLYIRADSKPGHHMIVCPWEDGHSGEAKDNDTFYYEPNYEGREEPFFRCFHESCQVENRWWRDVETKMGWSSVFKGVGDDDDEGRDEFVYVHRLEQFWDPRDGALITTKAFNSEHGGKTKKGEPTERFLASKSTKKVHTVEFLPDKGRIIRRDDVTVLNTYVDRRVRPDPSVDATPWTDHLEWVIPDDRDRRYLMDWIAWTYQRPGEKITWAPILYSKSYGVGKTTVFNALADCIGRSKVSEPTQAELEDKFNDWCYGKLLVKIEELMSEDKFHVAEKLKPVVANPTLSIRRMHQTGFYVENMSNVCASTNHLAALPIEKGDRRWMMIQCVEATREVRRPKMKAFHQWLERVGHGGIANWLAKRDVSRFSPKGEAPMTRLKELVIEVSMTELDRAIELCDIYDYEELVTSTGILSMFEGNGVRMYSNKLGAIAARRGWLSLSGQESRVRYGKGRATLWSPTGSREAIERVKAMDPRRRDAFLAKLDSKSVFEEQGAGKRADERWKGRDTALEDADVI